MDTITAKRVLEHLIRTGQGFCFTEYGIVSREQCEETLRLASEVPE